MNIMKKVFISEKNLIDAAKIFNEYVIDNSITEKDTDPIDRELDEIENLLDNLSIESLGGIKEAPLDGYNYARHNGKWVRFSNIPIKFFPDDLVCDCDNNQNPDPGPDNPDIPDIPNPPQEGDFRIEITKTKISFYEDSVQIKIFYKEENITKYYNINKITDNSDKDLSELYKYESKHSDDNNYIEIKFPSLESLYGSEYESDALNIKINIRKTDSSEEASDYKDEFNVNCVREGHKNDVPEPPKVKRSLVILTDHPRPIIPARTYDQRFDAYLVLGDDLIFWKQVSREEDFVEGTGMRVTDDCVFHCDYKTTDIFIFGSIITFYSIEEMNVPEEEIKVWATYGKEELTSDYYYCVREANKISD